MRQISTGTVEPLNFVQLHGPVAWAKSYEPARYPSRIGFTTRDWGLHLSPEHSQPWDESDFYYICGGVSLVQVNCVEGI